MQAKRKNKKKKKTELDTSMAAAGLEEGVQACVQPLVSHPHSLPSDVAFRS